VKARPAIVGTGSCVPDKIRYNDDPLFDWLHEHNPPDANLFSGYEERRVLADGQGLADIMVPAALRALAAAERTIDEVDLLLGYASVSEWSMPNDLARVAARLGLPPHATVLPINGEYANFNAAVLVADAMLALGRASCALVVVGGNWTRHVDYHTIPAVSAGDGAGAAVLAVTADPTRFAVVASRVEHRYGYLGGMYMAPDRIAEIVEPPVHLAPTFHLTGLGIDAIKDFGLGGMPALIEDLLAGPGIPASHVSIVGHQATAVLNGAWETALHPGKLVTTLPTLANMTLASIPVNLDVCYEEIATPYVVLAGLGPEVSGNVVLLSREPGARS
jgi:3-oxoacyl-[acyl-carrier-protein] synthase-3